MTLRIACFEDQLGWQDKLRNAFRNRAEFLFFTDPSTDWEVVENHIESIRKFKPSFIVVDLFNQAGRQKEAGYRVIRKLRESLGNDIPIIAWSILLAENTPAGQRYRSLVKGYRAEPLIKSKNKRPTAWSFLEKAKIAQSALDQWLPQEQER